jgi:hypothetical protein
MKRKKLSLVEERACREAAQKWLDSGTAPTVTGRTILYGWLKAEKGVLMEGSGNIIVDYREPSQKASSPKPPKRWRA